MEFYAEIDGKNQCIRPPCIRMTRGEAVKLLAMVAKMVESFPDKNGKRKITYDINLIDEVYVKGGRYGK